jgi:hypothetical protein
MKILSLLIALIVTGCIVVPEKDKHHVSKCEISSDHKTLRVVDVAKETNSYYSIGGLILYPLTGAVSGTYVAINNVYHLGEEKIVCG